MSPSQPSGGDYQVSVDYFGDGSFCQQLFAVILGAAVSPLAIVLLLPHLCLMPAVSSCTHLPFTCV